MISGAKSFLDIGSGIGAVAGAAYFPPEGTADEDAAQMTLAEMVPPALSGDTAGDETSSVVVAQTGGFRLENPRISLGVWAGMQKDAENQAGNSGAYVGLNVPMLAHGPLGSETVSAPEILAKGDNLSLKDRAFHSEMGRFSDLTLDQQLAEIRGTHLFFEGKVRRLADFFKFFSRPADILPRHISGVIEIAAEREGMMKVLLVLVEHQNNLFTLGHVSEMLEGSRKREYMVGALERLLNRNPDLFRNVVMSDPSIFDANSKATLIGIKSMSSDAVPSVVVPPVDRKQGIGDIISEFFKKLFRV